MYFIFSLENGTLGRPKIGVRISTFVPSETVDFIDKLAKQLGIRKRSEMVRELIKYAESTYNIKDCMLHQLGKIDFLEFQRRSGVRQSTSE